MKAFGITTQAARAHRSRQDAYSVSADFRTRKQHIDILKSMKRQDPQGALEYLSIYCPTVSRKAFEKL